MSWFYLVVVVVIFIWFLPSVQLFISDRFLDREYEVPDSINGSVNSDGLDPTGLYVWRNGRSTAVPGRAASTRQTKTR